MKTKFYILTLLSFFLFKNCLINFASASGSVIGNGGDPLFYFLEATRFSYTETLKAILYDLNDHGNENRREKFCQSENLSEEQILFCQDFFLQTASQIIKLNQPRQKSPFILKEETLFVLGPDGKPMPVAAKTLLGSDGEIFFHRDSLKLMPPTEALFLISHEFNHKAKFNDQYVTDNDPIGPFSSGRELLDAVANAIVEIAKQKGKIGVQFGLRDNFQCVVEVGGTRFGAKISTPRMFTSKDLMSYETGFGRNATDAYLYVAESESSNLILRMLTSEPANCAEDSNLEMKRKTELFIVRQSQTNREANSNAFSNTSNEEILTSKTLSSFNPICGKTPTEFSLAYQQIKFSCKYFGTEGTTNLKQNFKSNF